MAKLTSKQAAQIKATTYNGKAGASTKSKVTKALIGKATARTLPPAVKVPTTGTITLTVQGKAHTYRSATKAKQLKLAMANKSVAAYLAAGGTRGHLARMARWGIVAVK